MSDITKDEAVEKIKMFLENKGFSIVDSFLVSMKLKNDLESEVLDEDDEPEDLSDLDFDDEVIKETTDDESEAETDDLEADKLLEDEMGDKRKIIAKKPKLSFKGKG